MGRLMNNVRVQIIEYCDGFSIDIIDKDTCIKKHFSFDQEESIEESMIDVFKAIGIPASDVSYEEGY